MTTKPKTAPNKAAKAAARAPKATKPGKGATRATKPATKPAKAPTRGDEVIELLRRPQGVTIDELMKRFGILAHSARAYISVAARQRGLKVELVGRAHYRIV